MNDADEVKSRLDIADIIGNRIPLKKAGRHLKAICPFHAEKTPSLVVSPDRQIWKCFGCGKGGSVIDFIMEFDHLDFIEALELLAQQAGVTLDRSRLETPESKRKALLYEVNHIASEYYFYILTKHALGEKARIYLKTRGVSEKIMKTFMLGYSPNSWDGLYKYLHKKGYEDRVLEDAGLVLRSQRTLSHSYYDRFRGRVMFALADHRGNVVGFSGRVLDPLAKEAKYINTSETPVYSKSNMLYGLNVTKDAISKANQVIVMEGEFDVLSSYQAGVSNVVAIKGSALTEGHIQLLKRFTDRLVLSLDSDSAGDAAMRRGIEIADKAGFDIHVVELPIGKDPDEAARTDPVAFTQAMKKTVPYYDFCITSATKRYGLDSAYAKRKIGEELMPIVSRIENVIVRDHYIKKLARILDTREEAITDSLKRYSRSQQNPVKKTEHAPVPSTQSRLEKLELYILSVLLQGTTSDLFEEFKEKVSIQDISQLPVRRVMEALEQYLLNNRIFLIKDFADSLPNELSATIDEAYLADITHILESAEGTAIEWTKALNEYRRIVLRKKIQDLTTLLKKSTDVDDQSETMIQDQIQQVVKELKQLEKPA